MNPINWLDDNVPEFSTLSGDERAAIMHFSLLWSFFEAKALKTNASADSILKLSREWEDAGLLDPKSFASSLSYFRNRYFNSGEPTEFFDGLHLRANDNPTLVSTVLKNESSSTADSIGALLIIVFRLRNNLFHGIKWAYGLRGQLDNFTNANAVLMAALEIHDHL
jgi:hypothetical protein